MLSSTGTGIYKNTGVTIFDPPGEKEPGNDWVLVLEQTLEDETIKTDDANH